jgi:hypothetical protein
MIPLAGRCGEIGTPQGFKLLKFKMSEYLKNIVKLTISKI